ncbi:hypothetical protein Tco_0837101 [Tanacetum coccineum]
MLVQLTEDEGDASERQSEPQPTPSPPHPSTDQHETQPDPSPRPSPTIPIPASIPESFGGNHGDQVFDDVDVNDAMDYMETDAYMQKGVSTKDQDSTVKTNKDIPRLQQSRSVNFTLKPLPKIDPKDKDKKVLEEEAESDAESEGVDEAERKFDQLAKCGISYIITRGRFLDLASF